MSWRLVLEDAYTVECQACGVESVDPGKWPSQKWPCGRCPCCGHIHPTNGPARGEFQARCMHPETNGDEQRRGSEVFAWYSISGTVRVRRCPEVDAIAAKIRAHCDRDFAVNLVPMDSEVDDFSIEGTGEFAAGGVLVLDETLESLGPYAVEAAVLTGEYENEPCELVVAPTIEAGATALSHHRLDQIKPMLRELTAQDRESLVTLLREPAG